MAAPCPIEQILSLPSEPLSIPQCLRAGARAAPDAPALLGGECPPLTYGQLAEELERTRGALAGLGIGRGARVAVALPNGPAMAAAFLAVASAAACAPLDPDLGTEGFTRRLSRLRPDAVLRAAGAVPGLYQAAARCGVPVVDAHPHGACLGELEPVAGPRRSPVRPRVPGPREVALLLETSGTTSRPKLVPLTHDNLCFSALTIATVCRLGPADCCLNAMPLFHIHALVRCVLAPLLSGGSVYCTSGFPAASCPGWLVQSGATWYSGSPAIHRDVLVQANRAKRGGVAHRLRFIASAASPLPVQVMKGLEETFGVPVIDSYGMTEASPQITSNLLPPGRRKPGSVGVPLGPEVAIADLEGRPLPDGREGEILIRGRNVIRRYEGSDRLNEEAFRDGWLRTGDMGYVDDDGYLFITGRLKELINRGGEMISPRQVEQVLLGHPGVAEAACFGYPDERLGEEVAAMVVPREGCTAGEEEIVRFAAHRLSLAQVPKRVFIGDQLPRTRSGKVRRSALARRCLDAAAQGTDRAQKSVPNAAFRLVSAVWQQMLGVDRVSPGENFFELGGDSLTAARMLARLEAVTGRDIPAPLFYGAPTARELAAVLANGRTPLRSSELVPIQPEGTQPPFFFVCPGTAWVLFPLAKHLGGEQPLYGLSPWPVRGLEPPFEVTELADRYLARVREIAPAGPFLMGGISAGGTVAFEMACRLAEQGEKVDLLAMVDTLRRVPRIAPFWGAYGWINRAASSPRGLAETALRAAKLLFPACERGVSLRGCVSETIKASRLAARRYELHPYPGRITYLWSSGTRVLALRDPRKGWDEWCDELEVHRVPGYHHEALHEPNVRAAARVLRDRLRAAMRHC